MSIYRTLRVILCGASIFLCLISGATNSGADQTEVFDSINVDEINMIKGELVALKVYSLTRVSITSPGVADIADVTDQEILLVGKRSGQTALFIWDEHGKRVVMVYVFKQELDIVKSRMKKLLKIANIYEVELTINERERKVVISGQVPGYKRKLYDQIVDSFSGNVLDMAEGEKIEDLVQVDMQITELNTTLSKSLGIDWATGGAQGLAPVFSEAVPGDTAIGNVGDFFKIGEFSRVGQLVAAVQALVTEGKGRILSKPKLVVISGEEAKFLVGGEVPIRTTTFSESGSSQENISFKEYGISMTVTPTIKKEKVDVTMNLEVSEIDSSTATTISDDLAFSTRSASTRVFLDDGQTIVLAGLIRRLESETVSKIPFMGDIPVLGILFRSKVNPVPETDQELVISLTPRILRQKNPTDPWVVPDGEDKAALQQQRPGKRKFSYQGVAPYYLGIPKEMTGYVRDVQQKISQAIIYPHEARRYGWEGTVKVGVLILRDGTLAFALIKGSSGRDVFDEEALNVTKKLAPFPVFPSDANLKELSMTIPIMYSLGKN